MSDSALSLTLGELRSEVARYLQFGRGYNDLAGREKADVDSCIRRGVRQFLSPPPVDGSSESHTWSWLRPEGTLVTVASTVSYDLPVNFGGIIGPFAYQSSSDGSIRPIEVTSVSSLNARKQMDTITTGRPELAAILPKVDSSGDPARPSSFEVTLFPTPDSAYTLKYQYVATITDFTDRGNDAHVPGGQMHAETLIASCLSIAESLTTDQPGRYMSLFVQRLQASVSSDRRLNTAANLGQNLDRSDGIFRVRRSSYTVNYTP